MKAKIWNKSWWISETREKVLDNLLNFLSVVSGFHVLQTMEHEFTPYGYTKLWLLAESHLAVHTFPEHGRAYIELSSCNEQKFDLFVQEMERRRAGIGIIEE